MVSDSVVRAGTIGNIVVFYVPKLAKVFKGTYPKPKVESPYESSHLPCLRPVGSSGRATVKTLYVQPGSFVVRIPYNRYVIALQKVVTMAHVAAWYVLGTSRESPSRGFRAHVCTIMLLGPFGIQGGSFQVVKYRPK